MSSSAERLRDPRQRAERAARILDVAADLLLRHGYRRVTIDDVAAGVGIGKGTVYLHWKTREQMFGAVFAREVLYAMDELRQALRKEPQACLLHNFASAYFLAVANRPLLRGFLLDDPHLLGKLTNSADTARDDRHSVMARDYLGLLAEHGLLRDDMRVDEIGYAYQATFEGFLRAEGAATAGGQEQRADLLARTIQRAFESEQAIPETALRDLAATTVALIGGLIDADRTVSGIPEA
ncbi:helix-turn-helix domain-containing protein [Pseudofrankia sp. BMG5.37]|uniref:TetR/AcrR family transcriptional regulator n=1 Tax=Pseudofrankia sp. BMG5.37 TaxID=3050035 RepID=UPI002895A625|nr:helix-turn-helix domain-containing protein [Pseudofrankia sp. BMG5.37]MDT3439910.1 helix-turn-helix domain-containing protein [Pseudofrankia sp. BMG5.37]